MRALKITVLILLGAATGLIWYGVWRTHHDHLIVSFLDVGQGDALYIESPGGNQVLIDGGRGGAVLRELGRAMPFFDRTLDVVIATHPDYDHIGGLSEVLDAYRVQFIFEPGTYSEAEAYRAFGQKVTEEEGARHLLSRRGQYIDLGGGAYLRILFPDRDVTNIDSNASSIIAQLIYGDTAFVFTGDAPTAIEKYIVLREGAALNSAVLKVGHHGSKTSSAEAFVHAVAPEYAVVSAGRDNRYGHPHQEVLETLASIDAEVLGTYNEGAITFVSDGETVSLKK